MNILVVKYLPSGQNSSTKILLEHFIDKCSKHQIEQLDLLQNQPPIFNPESIPAYIARNYMGKELTEEQKKIMAPFDKLVNQVKEADLIVVSCPMHNFSYPGVVKIYFDAIMLHNETFKMGGPKKNIGLMEGKKALTIFSAAGSYPQGSEIEYLNNIKTLGDIEFNFMGYSEIKSLSASTGNPETKEENLNKAKQEIEALIQQWKL